MDEIARDRPESFKAVPGETASVSRACAILKVLESRRSDMGLAEISAATGIHKATAYRIVSTLVRHQMVEKTAASRYCAALSRASSAPLKIGYALQAVEFSFSQAVTESISASASRAHIELVILDNAYSSTAAVKNVDRLLDENVRLVIEFQTHASVAGIISAKLQHRHIPMIALEIPHPNAVYFGVNNVQAGLTAGRYLGRWALDKWRGCVDDVILLGLPMAGALPRSRLTGSLLGLREVMPILDDGRVHELDGNGQYEASYDTVSKYLREHASRHILVCAVNDPSALGALQAFRDVGREMHCAIVAQNASSEAIAEMQNPATRLIGSVGYFPERYGDQVIPLALDMIANKTVPATNFIKHHLITPANVKSYYPQKRTTQRRH